MGQLSFTTAEVQSRLTTVPTLQSTVATNTANISDVTDDVTALQNKINNAPVQVFPSTTTVTGQNRAIPANTESIFIRNSHATQSLSIGLGSTGTNAETATTGGTLGTSRFTIPPESDLYIDPLAYAFYAWKVIV